MKFEKLSWSYAGVLRIGICIVKNDLATVVQSSKQLRMFTLKIIIKSFHESISATQGFGLERRPQTYRIKVVMIQK